MSRIDTTELFHYYCRTEKLCTSNGKAIANNSRMANGLVDTEILQRFQIILNVPWSNLLAQLVL
jgi:hypothetical protein